MANSTLPIYTNNVLEVGRIYSTIEITDSFFPDDETVDLVNEAGDVRATGRIIRSETKAFDYIGYPQLKNNAAPQLQDWGNAAEYFKNRFADSFTYDAPIQIISFEVLSNMQFDTPLIEAVQYEQELGLPSDKELGITDEEESPVSYKVTEEV